MNQQDFQAEIIRKTTGEIRTFLSQLAYETSGYKSLHNLTEQVEHQYHGRFLIELIQNAHDAMNEHYGSDGDQGRLEILIDRTESPYGALYVANDGSPFTKSNFECLSQLGQSDKDPEKSIGNKGIGFRSVLEISNTPETYSRSSKDSEKFDGYCFYFSPNVTTLFEQPILDLINGDDKPLLPLDNTLPLIEWSQEQLLNFRSLYSSKDDNWLSKELKYLSPYLLPQSLITSLSLSVADILGADKELEKYKDLKRKQNRLTAVCGKEFDYSEDNLSQLWNHLIGQLDENALPKVELKNLSPLEAIAKRQKKTRVTAGKGGKPRGRTSKEMEHLIGFAGEIHAYRMLTKTYGEEVVHSGTWKSSYSKIVFPGNNPGVRLLPNPYEPKAQNVYSIEDAGARIRYRLKS